MGQNEPPAPNLFERCPDCGAAGSIRPVDHGPPGQGICAACSVHLRRSFFDGRWKVQYYTT